MHDFCKEKVSTNLLLPAYYNLQMTTNILKMKQKRKLAASRTQQEVPEAAITWIGNRNFISHRHSHLDPKPLRHIQSFSLSTSGVHLTIIKYTTKLAKPETFNPNTKKITILTCSHVSNYTNSPLHSQWQQHWHPLPNYENAINQRPSCICNLQRNDFF